ncbi:MAG: type IV secretory system conjugative DNA transfer family protein [Chloroflexi bacterium]|nr:type IV secretory system conjugative DNA transfer family protein [Chloroflexota bacterium]
MRALKVVALGLLLLRFGWDLAGFRWDVPRFAIHGPPTEHALLLLLVAMAGVVTLADYFGPEREEHPPLWVGGLLVLAILAAGAGVALSLRGADRHVAAALQHLSHVPLGLVPALLGCGGGILVIQRLGQPSPRRVTTHGSADWATGKDLRGLLAPARRSPQPGALLLAPSGRKALVLPPELARRHTLIVGGSGSGKTRGFFMPNAARMTGSVVATDPKGELWEATSGYHGEAWRFAPREPDASEAFNWIPLCREERTCQLLAAAAMQAEPDPAEQQFWKLADLQLCAALFAHVARLPVPTPATLASLLERGPTALVRHLGASPVPAVRAAAALLAELKPETRAGIVLSVANKLLFLQDPAVRRFTSAALEPPDFRRLTERPVAVYWVLHERDVAPLQPLSALFFTLLLEQLGRTPGGPVPVTLLLDEFAQIGRLPHFPTTIAVARGRGLSLVLGVQALSQLEGLYGRTGAETIRTNCATQVALHGLDYASAEQVSRALGERTVWHELSSRRVESLLATSWTHAEQHTGRRLLTPDEVRRIGHDQTLVICANLRPVRAGRWVWREPARTAETRALGRERALAIAPPEPREGRLSLAERLRELDEEEG